MSKEIFRSSHIGGISKIYAEDRAWSHKDIRGVMNAAGMSWRRAKANSEVLESKSADVHSEDLRLPWVQANGGPHGEGALHQVGGVTFRAWDRVPG
jgi:hypothetical protein